MNNGSNDYVALSLQESALATFNSFQTFFFCGPQIYCVDSVSRLYLQTFIQVHAKNIEARAAKMYLHPTPPKFSFKLCVCLNMEVHECIDMFVLYM